MRKIFYVIKIHSTDAYSSSGNQARNKFRKRSPKKCSEGAGEHFKALALSAERAHELLSKADSPYRFCVYQEGGEVFIDLVMRGAGGTTEKIIRKNITCAEFSDIINRIEKLDGFLVDFTA